MLTLDECRKILNKENTNYSNEQLEAIRDFFSDLAYVYLKSTKLTCDEENSSNLHKSIN